jgi:hypothetical protein
MASSDGEDRAPATAVRGQAPATTRHATGGLFVPHGPVLLHGVAHELGDKLSVAATGQAELFGLRDRADVVLKVYFAGRDPNARPSREILQRYQGLRSPHLVRLLGFGYGADGLDGQHDWELLERLEEVRVPEEEGARLAWIASSVVPAVRGAIDALLSHHLVHCDVKPENLMRRGSTGDLVLVDIGSLKEIDPQNRTSVTTVLSTTNAYAAPELLRQHVNDKTDAFALGMLLLKLVNPSLLTPPADKEIVARITENKPVIDAIPLAPRLTDLLNGLTRSAVSARWGVGELAIWCSGGTVSKVDSAPTLPPMRVQGRQITSVEELLSFMQDEGAFWGVCEDEGALPFTLRQWVNQLHDDEVGAALSRLVKRCLTEGKQEVGLVAVRRVLVPRAPLSVRGRQLAPTEDALSDFIARTGEVTADMEIALRVWSHRADAGRAARVLELVAPNSGDSDDPVGTAKRKRFDLFSGIGTISKDWAGAKIRCNLLRDSDGRLPAAELDAAAETIVAAVLVGSADGPWPRDLLPVAMLNPEASVAPECWRVVGLAVRRRHALLVPVTHAQGLTPMRLDAAGIKTASSQLLTSVCGWPPGKSWLQEVFGISEQVGDAEGVAEQVLLKTQRPWLLAGTAVVETPEALQDGCVRDAVMAWFGGDPVRGGRLCAWWMSHSAGARTFDVVSDPIVRAHLLIWMLGERGVWFGAQYLSAVAVADSLDEKMLNEQDTLKQRLLVLWLERWTEEVSWTSAQAGPVIAEVRANAVRRAYLARQLVSAARTFLVEDCPNKGSRVREVSWTEFQTLKFGLVVTAVDQGCRAPKCDCDYRDERCTCLFEMACANERKLAKRLDKAVARVLEDRVGGPVATVPAESLLLKSAVGLAWGDRTTLDESVRKIVGAESSIQSDESIKLMVTTRALRPWFVPAGRATSTVSRLWIACLLVLVVAPGCLAFWSGNASYYFDVRWKDFNLWVFLASMVLYVCILKVLSPFRFPDQDLKGAAGCGAVLFVIPLTYWANFPSDLSTCLSAGVAALSAVIAGIFLVRMDCDVAKYRWVLGLSVACIALVVCYVLSFLPRESPAWVSDPSSQLSVLRVQLESSLRTPVAIGFCYLLAAIFVGYAIGQRSREAAARTKAVTEANRILATFYEQILARVTGLQPAIVSDSRARTTAGGQWSAVIGKQRETKFWVAHIMIRYNRVAVRVVPLSWSKTTDLRPFGPGVGTADIVVQVAEADWNRVLTGAESPRALQAEGRLELSGDTDLGEMFVQKLAQFRETPR